MSDDHGATNGDVVRCVSDALQSEARAGYSVGEKISALVDRVLGQPPGADPNVRAALRALRVAHRLGLTRSFLSSLPALDDEEGWHELLGFILGAALQLVSDDVTLDVDACDRYAAAVFASLWED